MNQEVLVLILSLIALTIVFIVILLCFSMNYTSFKNKLEKRELDDRYKKELPYIKKEFYRTSITPQVQNGFVTVTDYNSFVKQNVSQKPYSYKEYYYYEDEKKKKRRRGWKALRVTLATIFYIICILLIALGIYTKVNGDLVSVGSTSYITVTTGSMSYVNETNSYLIENDIINQIPERSFIRVKKVEDPSDLKLYDIAVYKNEETNQLIVHRIIDEKEIDGERYFTFRGDANAYSDYYLINEDDVLYVYDNYRNSFLGNFFTYVASYQSIVAICYSIIALSILEAYDHKKKKLFALYRDEAINRINYREVMSVTYRSSDTK